MKQAFGIMPCMVYQSINIWCTPRIDSEEKLILKLKNNRFVWEIKWSSFLFIV